ncbi:hypothetical protein [Noviherbaspirillum sp. ST9]|uniref:hypothetical protein n=1 Tax=Noviherbaspirillum sp. ST9 TaxID=3401606 RepID=UPI003B58612A
MDYRTTARFGIVMEEAIMSTFNDNIRRQLGFGLISRNALEPCPATIPRPHAGTPAQVTDRMESVAAATLAARMIVPGGR